MSKPVIKYKQWAYNYIALGNSALVFPINHPCTEYYDSPVRTSRVIAHEQEIGRFETKNTIYEIEA